MPGQRIREPTQQLAREVPGLRRLIEDARLALRLIPLAAGDGSELNAGVHAHAVRAGDLRPSDGHAIRPVAPIRRMKDAHALREASRHQRQNGLAEPAQPRDDPLRRASIDNSPVHAQNYDVARLRFRCESALRRGTGDRSAALLLSSVVAPVPVHPQITVGTDDTQPSDVTLGGVSCCCKFAAA